MGVLQKKGPSIESPFYLCFCEKNYRLSKNSKGFIFKVMRLFTWIAYTFANLLPSRSNAVEKLATVSFLLGSAVMGNVTRV